MKYKNSVKLCNSVRKWLDKNKKIINIRGIAESSGHYHAVQNYLYGKNKTMPLGKIRAVVEVIKKLGYAPPVQKPVNTYEHEIINSVLTYLGDGIKPVDMQSTSRKRETVLSRQIAMIYRHKKMCESLKAAGEFYDKDHATVINSKKNIINLLDTDKRFAAMIDGLGEKIGYDFRDLNVKT